MFNFLKKIISKEVENMEEARKMICDRCRQAVPISNVRLMPRGKDKHIALCMNCRSQSDAPEKNFFKAPKAAVETYRCLRCNYKFKFRDNLATNFRCPYCGKDDCIAEDRKVNADRLIKLSE